MVRKPLFAVVLLMLLSAGILGLAVSAPVQVASAAFVGWESAWVKRIDNVTLASVNSLELIRDELDALNDDRILLKVITSTSTLYLINITNGNVLFSRKVLELAAPPSGGNVFAIFSSGDTRFLAIISGRTQVTIRDIISKQSITFTLAYTANPVPVSIAISPTGKYVIIGDRNGIVAVYAGRLTGTSREGVDFQFLRISGGETGIRGIQDVKSIDPNSPAGYIAITVGVDSGRGHLISKEGKPVWNTTVSSNKIRVTDVSHDGMFAVYAGDGGTVKFYRTRSSAALWSYTAVDDVLSIAMSGDGNSVVLGTDKPSGSANIAYFASAKTRTGATTPTWIATAGNDVIAVAVSKNGSRIVAGSLDDKAYFFDSAGSAIKPAFNMGNDIVDVAVSQDGRYALVASTNKASMFDLSNNAATPIWTHQKVSGDRGDIGAPKAIAISYDGNYAAVAGSKPALVVLRGSTGEILMTSLAGVTPSSAKDIAMSWDGRYIALVGSGGRVQYWDRTQSSPQWQNKLVSGDTKYVAMSYDGSILVAGSSVKGVYGWLGANKLHGDTQGPSWIYKTGDLDRDDDDDDDIQAGINTVAVSKEVHFQIDIEISREDRLLIGGGNIILKSATVPSIFVGELVTIQDAKGRIYRLDLGQYSQTIQPGDKLTLRFEIPANSEGELPGDAYIPTMALSFVDEFARPFNRQFKLIQISI